MQAQYFGYIWGGVSGVVGGVIGFVYGGPAGAAYGASIGWSIGNMWGSFMGQTFFPDKPHIYFPPPIRPHENRVQTSTWGTAIPIQYDCGRMAGNVIYMSPIVKTVNRSNHRQDGVRYYEMELLYTCTIVIAFCEPIENISRIWMNRKVFADYRNPLSPNYPQGDNELSFVNWETSIARSAIYFSIHLGSESQVADTALVALLGAADAPAYRGVTTVVLPNFPIGEFQGLPTVEIESNPVPHGNLLIQDNNVSPTKLCVMAGLTGTVTSELSFTHPYDGGQFSTAVAITPAGDLAKLWYIYSGGYTFRVYVFVGLSTTVRYYFTAAGCTSVDSLACEPITGRFILTGNEGATRGIFRIYEPDGTPVSQWVDTGGDYHTVPYNQSGATIIGFLQNPASPTLPGNMVCIYRNTYLVYYAGYDILYVYESYLGGARLYPTGNYYKVGPIVHDAAAPTSEQFSRMYFIQPRLLSDYIWAIHSNRLGYYKFRMSDLVTISTTNVTRVQLPASTYFTLNPPHDVHPDPNNGMCMTNGFEG
jgi:hypothetical protein